MLKINTDGTLSVFNENLTTKVFTDEGMIDVPTHVFTGTPEQAQSIVDSRTSELEVAQARLEEARFVLDTMNSYKPDLSTVGQVGENNV